MFQNRIQTSTTLQLTCSTVIKKKTDFLKYIFSQQNLQSRKQQILFQSEKQQTKIAIPFLLFTDACEHYLQKSEKDLKPSASRKAQLNVSKKLSFMFVFRYKVLNE